MKTYAQWGAEGRTVEHGAKAVAFMVPPNFPDEVRSGVPLFDESQTVEADNAVQPDWRLLAREDYYAQRAPAPKKPVVKLEYNFETRTLWIWCGRNQDLIRICRKADYRFDMTRHRWRKKTDDPVTVARNLAKPGRWEIQANFPYEEEPCA